MYTKITFSVFTFLLILLVVVEGLDAVLGLYAEVLVGEVLLGVLLWDLDLHLARAAGTDTVCDALHLSHSLMKIHSVLR